MSRLSALLQDLESLQGDLQGEANRLWGLESALNRARPPRYKAGDFLPRRLRTLQSESQQRFDLLLKKLSLLLVNDMPGSLLGLAKAGEGREAARLRTLLRCIQNAYVTDLPLRENLENLRRSLPR